MKYSLEVKQLVRFPYCRIYRSFIDQITADHSLRKHGDGLLFYYMVLFSLANYRTSYRNLDGICFTVYAGEWVARYSELCEKMDIKYHYQLITILRRLQDMHLESEKAGKMARQEPFCQLVFECFCLVCASFVPVFQLCVA